VEGEAEVDVGGNPVADDFQAPELRPAQVAKDQTEFDAPFQALITEGAWGSVWSRPHWSKRERSMVTIALLAALGHDEELAMHVRATRNTGASEADLREAMMHVAIYAGIPAANHAIKIIKKTYAEPAAPQRNGSAGRKRAR